jgi:hypothetical protein
MKKTFLLIFSVAAFFAVQAQAEIKLNELLDVKETEYNFGKIPQGKPVYHNFEVVNKSDLALKLDNVVASCGCTTPEWSKDAIAPNGTSVIKVGYNAAAEGHFEKTITITYSNNLTKVIRIKGEVWKAPAGAAPSNASVQFLKQQLN